MFPGTLDGSAPAIHAHFQLETEPGAAQNLAVHGCISHRAHYNSASTEIALDGGGTEHTLTLMYQADGDARTRG